MSLTRTLRKTSGVKTVARFHQCTVAGRSPVVERGVAHDVFAAQLGGRKYGLVLLQDRGDLLVAGTALSYAFVAISGEQTKPGSGVASGGKVTCNTSDQRTEVLKLWP